VVSEKNRIATGRTSATTTYALLSLEGAWALSWRACQSLYARCVRALCENVFGKLKHAIRAHWQRATGKTDTHGLAQQMLSHSIPRPCTPLLMNRKRSGLASKLGSQWRSEHSTRHSASQCYLLAEAHRQRCAARFGRNHASSPASIAGEDAPQSQPSKPKLHTSANSADSADLVGKR